MKERCKRYRDLAKTAVFSHLSSAILAVIFSSIVASVITTYYQYTAIEKNVDIFSADPEVLKMTLIVTLASFLINLPLSFCSTRFYLIISRKTFVERATVKEFFEPFTRPGFLLKSSLLVLLTSFLNAIGAFVLVFPVYFMYCMSAFIISDNPDISPIKALTLSRRMMKGNKWLAFRATFPILLLYSVLMGVFSSMIMFSFFVLSVIEAVFFVTLAIIYEDLKKNNQ